MGAVPQRNSRGHYSPSRGGSLRDLRDPGRSTFAYTPGPDLLTRQHSCKVTVTRHWLKKNALDPAELEVNVWRVDKIQFSTFWWLRHLLAIRVGSGSLSLSEPQFPLLSSENMPQTTAIVTLHRAWCEVNANCVGAVMDTQRCLSAPVLSSGQGASLLFRGVLMLFSIHQFLGLPGLIF